MPIHRFFKIGVFLGCGIFAGCASFDHLTHIPAAGESGPGAKECSACHVEQYREWQTSIHAQSFVSPTFLEAAGNPPEQECLPCHSPLGMRDNQMVSRAFNQDEGITCVSCHLIDGRMHGPHGSTALASPHPIQEDRAAFAGPALCAGCHGETFAQWQKAAAQGPAPTCQECHLAAVQRTATQGTNLFSNMLVAFEKKVPTRSHDVNLEHMAPVPGGVSLTIAPHAQGADTIVLEATVRNSLPHNLPTGTYGDKELRLVPVAEKGGRRLTERSVVIGNGSHALGSGEAKKALVTLTAADLQSGPIRLDLERESASHAERNPIVLASSPIHSTQKVLQ
jgi:nitrate/TMAO reductase-like tetraheme cytochrome c subunit